MKKTKNKLGNKGFSLVELIVVIAIMAVLIGVLAPTLIKNIEKSRKSKDEQNLDEIRGSITTVLADDTYYSTLADNEVYIAASDGTISVKTNYTPAGGGNSLLKELTDTISKEKVPMTSKDYKGKKVTFVITNGKVSAPSVSS